MKINGLTLSILIGMFAGVIAGFIVHSCYNAMEANSFAGKIELLTTIFLRLIQMIIAPLVFTTLTTGIAKLGNVKTVGRIGGKALFWFIMASLVSLSIGLILVNITTPGRFLSMGSADITAAHDLLVNKKALTLEEFIKHVFPRSLFEAMSVNEILHIVVFSIFFGLAAAALGETAKPLISLLETASKVILKMTGYVMYAAPFGVFGALAGVVARKGLSVFQFYGAYFIAFLSGILILWLVLTLVGYAILGKRMKGLFNKLGGPLLIAFSTTSSEAVFPRLTKELEAFGCRNKIVSFILPLGYSFNLDGSMMYMSFASIVIAQVYQVPMDITAQISMLLVLMITSKGIAGVPRASLLVIAATGSMFGIPPEGIALILPIDHFCDMFRSMTNVLGNGLATSVVSKWEGELGGEK